MNIYSLIIKKNLLLVLAVLGWFLAILGIYNWKINAEKNTITVSGSSRSIEKNRLARFNAGVSILNPSKEEAVKQMNEKSTAIVDAVKEFGISDTDIKTQNVNIYQEQNWDPYAQKSTIGDWRASTDIEIVLRDVNRASDLSAILSSMDITNLWGPNFAMDDDGADEATLLAQALDDAREKAEAIAKASDRKLGKLVTFNEGSAYGMEYPMSISRDAGGGGGAMPVEPGSSQVYKAVTVTYRLR